MRAALESAAPRDWKGVRHKPVEGSPYQPGDWVRVVWVIDETVDPVHVGRKGLVHHLEYDCGCGQRYPDDPMIGVRLFCTGLTVEFWHEELEPLLRSS